MSRVPEPAGTGEVFLYQAATKLYPRRAQGRYARLRLLSMLALLGLYYALPWIEVGGAPLVWFDLPHRRFHVFTLTLAPQDLIYLTWLLLMAALTLFLFTTLAGRLWCGYACPQTVWTEAFLWIEHFTEGDRYARIKLDRSPWTARKILRKGTKHLLWAGFALYTGLTFVAYFVPAPELFGRLFGLQLVGWPLFWVLFYGLATWGNAGVLREQVCKYMCPYARFQSAMFDKDTLIIAYDPRRGEPRKGLVRKLMAQRAPTEASVLAGERSRDEVDPGAIRAGDCIDCSLCVQVCPTGIDIRQGLQYECIACAACIDACDRVMDSVHQPRGLIRYTSAHAERGERFRLLRPRVIGYGLVWATLCVGFVVALGLRTPLQFDVIRDRHSLYRQLDDGSVENLYTLKISNEDRLTHRYRLTVTDREGRVYRVEPDHWTVLPGEPQAPTVSVRTPPPAAEGPGVGGIRQLDFRLAAEDRPDLLGRRDARFIAGDRHD